MLSSDTSPSISHGSLCRNVCTAENALSFPVAMLIKTIQSSFSISWSNLGLRFPSSCDSYRNLVTSIGGQKRHTLIILSWSQALLVNFLLDRTYNGENRSAPYNGCRIFCSSVTWASMSSYSVSSAVRKLLLAGLNRFQSWTRLWNCYLLNLELIRTRRQVWNSLHYANQLDI